MSEVDCWPYWQPHPAICTEGVFGPEWHPLSSVTDIYEQGLPKEGSTR